MSWRRVNVDDRTVLDALWDNAQIGIAIVAVDGSWLTCNRTLCLMLEYSDAELRGLTWQKITHPHDTEADQEMVDDLRAGRATGYDMVKRYLTKSGRTIWTALRVIPLHDGDRQLVAYLSQVSPVVPVAAPAEERRVRTNWRWVRDYWPQILTIASVAGAVIGAAIQYLRK